MPYQLGIDLGTTYTAAAVRRDGRSEIVALQHSESTIPSVVFFGEDGAILTGEPANQRALTRPERVAREFKRRSGDPTPFLIAGRDHTVESLTADLLRWVVRTVTHQQGELPTAIALCHPANWGPHKVEALAASARLARVNVAVFLSEPEAAAIHYATQERIDPGTVIAVYDLGGGTFDATVLRKTAGGFEILGQPRGVDQLGGIDFDELVFRHVIQSVGNAFAELDPDDPTAMLAVARLRRDCVTAKEYLSSDTVALIPVLLPNAQAEVRLTRAEFEAMIRPLLVQSIDALQAAVASARLTPSDIDTVLLVGGSSRIPLASQMVGSSLGRPVSIDVHSKHAVALGASVAASLSGFRGPASDDASLFDDPAYQPKGPALPYDDPAAAASVAAPAAPYAPPAPPPVQYPAGGYPSQPYPAQPYPPQPQPYPAQPYQGEQQPNPQPPPYPPQQYPPQQYPPQQQPYPAQPYQGEQQPGQQYPGQQPYQGEQFPGSTEDGPKKKKWRKRKS